MKIHMKNIIHMKNKINDYIFLRKIKEINCLIDPNVDGRILKWILNKNGVRL